MIMRNRLITYTFAIAITGILLTACKKDDEVGGTAVQKLSGEWWIQLKVNNTPVIPNYFKVSTYNTSQNVGTEMWLDFPDWPFKGKVSVDANALTFQATKSQSDLSAVSARIQNGKILQNGSKGPSSKAVTDSIYFEGEFTDDPGTTYQITGYRRTRYSEDDH
jgi:hypothetical protein